MKKRQLTPLALAVGLALIGQVPQLPGMHLVPEHPRGQGQT